VDRGYVPRQLCLQALRYSMGELADPLPDDVRQALAAIHQGAH
jgi:hypothetical protein